MNSPRSGVSLLGSLIFLVIAGTVVAVLLAWATGKFQSAPTTVAGMITEQVKQGPLEIIIKEKGNLESAANVTLQSKVEGTVAIIKIVEEGTAVKKGDSLVVLDSSKFRNDATQQEIALKQAEAAEAQAMEARKIQETQNASDISAAELKLALAKLDLEKYKLGESVQELNQIEGEIALAKEDLTRAKEKYAFTGGLSKKGYATQSELEADRIAVERAKNALAIADEKKRVLQTYTYKRMVAEKEANASEGERELERVKLKAAAALIQADADLSSRKLAAKVEKTKYDRLMDQIANCEIKAPQEGIVVYANERNSRGSTEVQIAEGSQVRERQAIIHLPDVSKMRVSARVHESKIDMVREGLPVQIRVDARPGEVFRGEVDMVSLVPLSGNWPNFNLKEYATLISIKDDPQRVNSLKPQMTAEVEILADRLDNALQVPIQAVIERGGRHFTFVFEGGHASRREIKVGRTNDMVIEIKDGLKKDETVILNPRSVFGRLVAELEAEVPEKKAEANQDFKGLNVPPDATPRGERKAAGREGVPGSGGPGRGPGTGPGGEGRPPGPGGPGAGSPGGAPGGGFDIAAIFQRNDKNSDGKITEDEMDERFRSRFPTMDANGDKSVDMTEFTTAMEAARRNFGGGGPGGGGPGAGGPGAGGPGAGGPGGAPGRSTGGGGQ